MSLLVPSKTNSQSLPTGSDEIQYVANVTDAENGRHSDIPGSSSFKKQQVINGTSSIIIEDLPPNLRKVINELELDLDGDGRLDTNEIIMAIENLATKTKTNTSLKKIVWVQCGFFLLLIICLFGTSITAARLAKDTEVDPLSGIMYAKGSGHHTTMKTEDVVIYTNSKIAEMTNEELSIIKEIVLSSGDVKFQVKGYARSSNDIIDGNKVKLLVEGGTITYDTGGIMDASGDAEELLTYFYGDFEEEEEEPQGKDNDNAHRRHRRRLQRMLSDSSSGGCSTNPPTDTGQGGTNDSRGSF